MYIVTESIKYFITIYKILYFVSEISELYYKILNKIFQKMQ
jgi:hypothetical protein